VGGSQIWGSTLRVDTKSIGLGILVGRLLNARNGTILSLVCLLTRWVKECANPVTYDTSNKASNRPANKSTRTWSDTTAYRGSQCSACDSSNSTPNGATTIARLCGCYINSVQSQPHD